MPGATRTVHQLKVTLKGIRPPIWRRFQVSSSTSLAKLHAILQEVMGWYDCHLHEFIIDGIHYGLPDDEFGTDVRPESRATLKKLIPAAGARFRYIYDFGDDWEHEVVVEKVLPAEPKTRYPFCLAGKRACPPEDCGGPYGYERLLEALKDPSDPENEELAEWVGGEFDAEAFDIAGVNAALQGGWLPPEGRTGSSPAERDG